MISNEEFQDIGGLYVLINEAHRFGITHHRALRGKANLKSALSEIEGIGPRKQQALIRHFKSVKAIFEASKEELMQVDGISEVLAQRILDHNN